MPLSSRRCASRASTSLFVLGMTRSGFFADFRVWRDTRDPSFVFDLSSPILVELPLPADVLRDYTLEYEIRLKRALIDLRECLKEAVKDRDCYKELANTFIEDIEETSNAHDSELATVRAELDRRGLAPLGTEAKCIQLRFRVVDLEDKLVDLT